MDGYSNCSWVYRPGNGGVYAYVTIKFKAVDWDIDDFGSFISRAILVYTYDKDGAMAPMPLDQASAWINDVEGGSEYTTSEYSAFFSNSKIHWLNRKDFTANVRVYLTAKAIKEWQAISIRAGNEFARGMQMEMSGGAYVSVYQEDDTCTKVDPTVPPVPSISINMTAPDWDLGDLPIGEGKKVFTARKDQLCFTYTPSMVASKKFVIAASSTSGVVNKKFQLKNVLDKKQVIPYTMTVDNGVDSFDLPNLNSIAVSLNSSGQTCFVPTFKTSVDPSAKPGDYNDVVIFTVFTKS
jgi:hypothetical protein